MAMAILRSTCGPRSARAPQVDLSMAIAIVTRHRGRCAAIELADRAVGNAENRGMHEGRVIAIAFVFQDEFPVGLDAMLEEAGRDLDLALRREANQTVDGLGSTAKMLFQRRAFGCERAEHETAIRLHPRHTAERKF